jgi:hypothetical protein
MRSTAVSTLNRLRVFLSSPGDVLAARAVVRDLVERELQKERAFRNTKLEVVSWDDPDAPVPLDAYLTPQQAIDRDLPRPSECDVVVVILWSRMGTPLTYDGQSYLSGTHYEYLGAVSAERRPRVLLFRCTVPPQEAWSTVAFHETPEQQRAQLSMVERFFGGFSNDDGTLRGSFMPYRSVDEFGRLARQLLRDVLQERLEQLRSGPAGDLGIALSFRRKLTDFREEYLISERGRVPFGGRDAELDRLDHWLEDEKRPPRFLITAPAGRGKSALVVQWMEQLEAGRISGDDDWRLAFMPISIRVDTNRPEEFYQGLALRLVEISGLPLDETQQRDVDYFKASARKQLEHIAREGRKVLVVLDGIDEALEGSFDAAIVPKLLPPTLRVVVSARTQVGDSETDSKGWLRRLGWDRDTRVEAMELEKLDAERIANVLVRLGAPMDVLARDPGLVHRLADLTEGEPLLVRFYVTDLWDRSLEGARITAADLDTLKPGFGSYFSRWMEQQERLWKEEGAGIDAEKADRVLLILAHALGRLPEMDLLALMREVHGETELTFADRLLRPLRRFVMGDGKPQSGFVLSHPKIGDYLRAERFHAVEKPVRRAFATWGSKHLAALNAGKIGPGEASRYLLLYLPRHLEVVGAPPSDFLAMVEDGWRRAWEHWEGGQRGFAAAVRAAWDACRRDGPIAHLGWQWRCALTLSSIVSMGRNIPVAVVVPLVKDGTLAPLQARYYAELKGAATEAVEALAAIALTKADNPSTATEMALAAVDLAMTAHNEGERAKLLAAALEYLLSETSILPAETRDAVLHAAGERSQFFTTSTAKACALTSIASHTVDPMRAHAIKDALENAEAIGPPHERAKALTALVRVVVGDKRRVVAERALHECIAIIDGKTRSHALIALAPYLDQAQLQVALNAAVMIEGEGRRRVLSALAPHLNRNQRFEALQAARDIKYDNSRALALAALAPYFDAKKCRKIVAAALQIASTIRSPTERSRIFISLITYIGDATKEKALVDSFWTFNNIGERLLSGPEYKFNLFELVPHLNGDLVNLALNKAHEVVDDYSRIHAFAALIPFLDTSRRKQVLGDALNAVEKISGVSDRSNALAVLAPLLEPSQRSQALRTAVGIRNGKARSRALTALAPFLDPADRTQALRAAMRIGDEEAQSWVLAALAPHLAPGQQNQALGDALQAAEAIGDEEVRFRALTLLAPHLEPGPRSQALAQAKQAALSIGNEESRSKALLALVPLLDTDQRSQALQEAMAIGDKGMRSRTLAVLAPHLEQGARSQALADALEAATSIGDETSRSQTLAALTPHLGTNQRIQAVAGALQAAEAIADEEVRSRVLGELAPRLNTVQLSRALLAAGAIGNECQRSHAFSALAPNLDTDQLGQALRAATAIGNECCRSNALEALAPHLGVDQRRQALQATMAIRNELFRSRPLGALAPFFEPDQQSQALADALQTATAISDERARAQALAKLVTHLEVGQRAQALQMAVQIDDEASRSVALLALAPLLDADQRSQALKAAMAIGDKGVRSGGIRKPG